MKAVSLAEMKEIAVSPEPTPTNGEEATDSGARGDLKSRGTVAVES